MCSISTFYLWNFHYAYFFDSESDPGSVEPRWAQCLGCRPLATHTPEPGLTTCSWKGLSWEPLAPPEFSLAAQNQRATLNSAEWATPQQRKRFAVGARWASVSVNMDMRLLVLEWGESCWAARPFWILANVLWSQLRITWSAFPVPPLSHLCLLNSL